MKGGLENMTYVWETKRLRGQEVCDLYQESKYPVPCGTGSLNTDAVQSRELWTSSPLSCASMTFSPKIKPFI